mgnify:CR=1 FL=1
MDPSQHLRPSAPRRSLHRRAGFSLALVVIAAAALRLAGIHWGLPNALHPDFSYHPDEAYHVLWARWLVEGRLIPKHFMYGGTLHYTVLNAYWHYGRIFAAWLGGIDPLADALLFGRCCVVLFSLLSIAVTAAIGQRLFGPKTGLLAAAILGVAPAHVFLAQNVRPDELATLFAALIVYIGATILRGDPIHDLRGFVLAGILTGLAIALRAPLAAFGVAPFAAYLLRDRVLRAVPLARLAFAAGLGLLGGYALGSPHSFLHGQALLDGLAIQRGYQTGAFPDAVGRGSGVYQYGWRMLREALGPPFQLLASAGLLLALFTRRREALYLVLAGTPYFAATTLVSWVVVRYTLPLTPLLALLAATAVRELARAGRLGAGVALAWAALGFVFTTLGDLAFLNVERSTNVRERVTAWIRETVPPGSALVSLWEYPGDYFYSPPLPSGYRAGAFVLDEKADPRTLEGVGIDYLVVAEPIYGNLDRLGAAHPKPGVRALRPMLAPGGPFVLEREFSVPVTFAGIDFGAGFRSQDFMIINPGIRVYRRIGP